MYKEYSDYRSLSDINCFPDTAVNLTLMALFAECILISGITPMPMPAGEDLDFPGRNRSSRISSLTLPSCSFSSMVF